MFTVGRDELITHLHKAENRIRVFGTVAFDLPFDEFKEEWLNKVNSGIIRIDIICESEASLYKVAAISSDKNISHHERGYDSGTFINIKNEPQKKIRDYFLRQNCMHLEPEEDSLSAHLKTLTNEERAIAEGKIQDKVFDMSPFRQCLSIRTYYLEDIKIPVLNIDDVYYVGHALTKFNHLEIFLKISEHCNAFCEYEKYFQYCFDNEMGAKRYSTEITQKDNRTEVILAYNDKRQVIGQLPRDSFLNSTRPKLVVWGMIFTRDGKLLIHQRSANAKDNQGMWDKSIGGHVDINDIDTVKAAAREMIEELYKVEVEAQSGHSRTESFNVNTDKHTFLGEWKPEMRYTLPFKEIADNEGDVYFFRMDYSLSKIVINSPRIFSDGSIHTVKVFVDLYVFIMPRNFSNTLSSLKNSKYALLELYQLKDNFLKSRNGNHKDINGKKDAFKVTPDLEYIINSGSLWEVQLTSFVDYLKTTMS